MHAQPVKEENVNADNGYILRIYLTQVIVVQLKLPVALCLGPLTHGGPTFELETQILHLRVQLRSPVK